MELAVSSPKPLTMEMKMLTDLLIQSAERERVKKAAIRSQRTERELLAELPYSERRDLLDLIAGAFPPEMRPKITYPDTAAPHPEPHAGLASA